MPQSVARDHMYRGLMVPGKDVRVPTTGYMFMKMKDGIDSGEACAAGFNASAPARSTMLLWQGSVKHHEREIVHPVRQRAVAAFRGLPGYALRDGSVRVNATHVGQERTEGVAWEMGRSRFCLAPDGVGGGFGARDSEATGAGCVPLYVNDNTSRYYDEALAVDAYAVTVEEARLQEVPSALEAAAAPAALLALQRQLFCACAAQMGPWGRDNDRFHGSWADSAALERQDAVGGFAALMAVLRGRLGAHSAAWARWAAGLPPAEGGGPGGVPGAVRLQEIAVTRGARPPCDAPFAQTDRVRQGLQTLPCG